MVFGRFKPTYRQFKPIHIVQHQLNTLSPPEMGAMRGLGTGLRGLRGGGVRSESEGGSAGRFRAETRGCSVAGWVIWGEPKRVIWPPSRGVERWVLEWPGVGWIGPLPDWIMDMWFSPRHPA